MTIKQNGATKAAPFHIDKKVIAHLIKNHQVDFFTHDVGEKGVNGHWKDKQEFPSVNQIIDNKNYHIRTRFWNWCYHKSNIRKNEFKINIDLF